MAQPAPGGRFGLAAGRQRALVIAAAGGVFLLVFFFVILPNLFGGGGGGGGTTAQPPLARPRVTTTTLPRAGAPPESFEVFNTKNPFTPLTGPAGAGGGATTGTTVPGGTVTTPTGGAGPGATTGTTVAGGGGAAGGAATEPRRSQRVALVDVRQSGGGPVADVRVNDTVFRNLAPGATFASNFKVVSLQGQCGTFLFGDERFQLCKGEEVLK